MNNKGSTLMATVILFSCLFIHTAVFANDEAVDVVIETKFGNIELKLFPDIAPGHVENFLKLAKSSFYDGTIFHRVIPGFMIQGGDPNSKGEDKSTHGTGGPGYAIDAEFNDKPHVRGTLSMARSRDPDSAGSQFFIVVKKSSFLDHQYTVFGVVVSGLEVVDEIVSQKKDARDNPIERIEMKIRVIEAENIMSEADEKG
ncbi:MAG: peptidylprolyl isomerase [Proteobacteria bacterium]|nr:peptidylprolyl isomerase [Pseudomonadota bacterium]